MPEVIYDGPFPEVSVNAGYGRRPVNAVKGEPVEVSDELAESLLEQSDIWSLAKSKPKAATKPVEPAADTPAKEDE